MPGFDSCFHLPANMHPGRQQVKCLGLCCPCGQPTLRELAGGKCSVHVCLRTLRFRSFPVSKINKIYFKKKIYSIKLEQMSLHTSGALSCISRQGRVMSEMVLTTRSWQAAGGQLVGSWLQGCVSCGLGQGSEPVSRQEPQPLEL